MKFSQDKLPCESFPNCTYPFADVLQKMYAMVSCQKQIVLIFQIIQEKYRLLNTFSAKLDPIYFSILFAQLTEDLCPNSTSLTHFLQRYCSVLLCIYTRLAGNRFLVDRVLSEQPRYILTTSFFVVQLLSIGRKNAF